MPVTRLIPSCEEFWSPTTLRMVAVADKASSTVPIMSWRSIPCCYVMGPKRKCVLGVKMICWEMLGGGGSDVCKEYMSNVTRILWKGSFSRLGRAEKGVFIQKIQCIILKKSLGVAFRNHLKPSKTIPYSWIMLFSSETYGFLRQHLWRFRMGKSCGWIWFTHPQTYQSIHSSFMGLLD